MSKELQETYLQLKAVTIARGRDDVTTSWSEMDEGGGPGVRAVIGDLQRRIKEMQDRQHGGAVLGHQVNRSNMYTNEYSFTAIFNAHTV